MVTIEQLRELYYAEPFEPFVLVHRDGSRILIDDPTVMAYSDVSKLVVYPGRYGIQWATFDAVQVEPVEKEKRRRRKAS